MRIHKVTSLFSLMPNAILIPSLVSNILIFVIYIFTETTKLTNKYEPWSSSFANSYLASGGLKLELECYLWRVCRFPSYHISKKIK